MIPRYMLRKIAGMGNGYRLSKWTPFKEPANMVHVGPSKFSRFSKQPPLIPGGTGDVYRFWQIKHGVVDGHMWMQGQCRACGTTCNALNTMREHQRDRGCAKKLVEAYKLLQRDLKCVVCDKFTKESRWGVPMCSQECVESWKKDVVAPHSLEQALQLVWMVN